MAEKTTRNKRTNAMRSEERKKKSPTEKGSGDATMPAVRGYDAEGRGMLRQALEMPEQAVPMAYNGELGEKR